MACMMSTGLLCMVLLLIILLHADQRAASDDYDFIYNGFQAANLSLSGSAHVSSNGVLQLTDDQILGKYKKGYAFHPTPLRLKNSSADGGGAISFSTSFVFAVVDEYSWLDLKGQGFAFVLSPSVDLPHALPAQYMGLFNATNDGDEANHLVAVELDTSRDPEFGDVDANHVGIDVNGLRSVNASPASYFSYQAPTSSYGFQSVRLAGGERLQLWIDYDGAEARLDVTLSPFGLPKPGVPLLSSVVNVPAVILDHTYVGFSASTGYVPACFYVLGWSFTVNGRTGQMLDLSQLPPLPRTDQIGKKPNIRSGGRLLVIAVASILLLTIVFLVRRRLRYPELIEEYWESGFAGGHTVEYKEQFLATNGVKASELPGVGGVATLPSQLLP